MIIIQFILVVFSIFSVFITGFIVGKTFKLDIKTLTFISINLFFPILVFLTFYHTKFSKEYINILFAITLLYIALYSLILFYSKLKRFNRNKKSALLLSGLFMNSGNYGVPIILFSLGNEGYVYAIIIMVLMDFNMNTLGVYIASSGGTNKRKLSDSLLNTMKSPVVIATILGIVFNILNIQIIPTIESTLSLLADAAIPLIMIVLGIQLSTVRLRNLDIKPIAFISMLRLIISPMVMLLIVYFLNLHHSIIGSVLIIIASMPSAANTTLFSIQYDTEPEFVSSLTLITTLLSILTLPIWLTLIIG